MRETLVRVDGLYKKFSKKLRSGMFYALGDISKSILGLKVSNEKLRKNEFWALQNINFELKRGEVLGLVGRNGSGKTTLLRLLSGIFPPDKGRIEVNGRLGALIAVGAGFHPHMSGRENIFLNGIILGISREELKTSYDDIVEFAEIADFVDAPVATYSSGMRVRLGFAIAIHSKPDILLVDEVLAVGDVGFKAKCYSIISELLKKSAVILVSHSMPEIARICSKILLLSEGRCRYAGNNVSKGIDLYHKLSPKPEGTIIESDDGAFEEIIIEAGSKEVEIPYIDFSQNLSILIKARLNRKVTDPIVHIAILNQEFQNVYHCTSRYSKHQITINKGGICTRVILESLSLRPGIYYLDFAITDQNNLKIVARTHLCHQIQIRGKLSGYAPILAVGKWENI